MFCAEARLLGSWRRASGRWFLLYRQIDAAKGLELPYLDVAEMECQRALAKGSVREVIPKSNFRSGYDDFDRQIGHALPVDLDKVFH